MGHSYQVATGKSAIASSATSSYLVNWYLKKKMNLPNFVFSSFITNIDFLTKVLKITASCDLIRLRNSHLKINGQYQIFAFLAILRIHDRFCSFTLKPCIITHPTPPAPCRPNLVSNKTKLKLFQDIPSLHSEKNTPPLINQTRVGSFKGTFLILARKASERETAKLSVLLPLTLFSSMFFLL